MYNLDRAYLVKLLINVIKGNKPIILQFDACQVILCGDLNNQRQLQAFSIYMCPYTSLRVNGLSLVLPEMMNGVPSNTKAAQPADKMLPHKG